MRGREGARRCGEKHIWKSIVLKLRVLSHFLMIRWRKENNNHNKKKKKKKKNNNNNKNNKNSDEISTAPPLKFHQPKDNLKFQPPFCASVDSHSISFISSHEPFL